ncbi:MAG TPA: M48 family metalloprotease [Rubrivivax sp.]|nr:M48 family metalloprotease [Rubrivivax sp.]
MGALAGLATLAASGPLLLRWCGARRVEEDGAPQLLRTLRELALRASVPAPALYLIDDAAPVALATGNGPRRGAIALSTGLLSLLSEAELRAVIAHELAHIRRGDAAPVALGAVLSGALLARVGLLPTALGGEALDSDGAGEDGVLSPAAWALLLLAPLAALPLRLALRRGREFDADAAATRISGDARALADALLTIEHAALRHPPLRHPPLAALLIVAPGAARGWRRWLAGHPPTAERIARLRAGSR